MSSFSLNLFVGCAGCRSLRLWGASLRWLLHFFLELRPNPSLNADVPRAWLTPDAAGRRLANFVRQPPVSADSSEALMDAAYTLAKKHYRSAFASLSTDLNAQFPGAGFDAIHHAAERAIRPCTFSR